jgi:DMSO/TMAO reductase YedYZ heme-binding membrane subunit
MRQIQVDPDIIIVIATLVTIFSASSSIAGWAERRMPWMAVSSLAIGLGLLGYVHLVLKPGGLSLWDIPTAFVHVAAMVLN